MRINEMKKTIETRLIELAEAYENAKRAKNIFAEALDKAVNEKIREHIELNKEENLDFFSVYAESSKGEKYNFIRQLAFEDVVHLYSNRVEANIRLGAIKGGLLKTGQALKLKQEQDK